MLPSRFSGILKGIVSYCNCYISQLSELVMVRGSMLGLDPPNLLTHTWHQSIGHVSGHRPAETWQYSMLVSASVTWLCTVVVLVLLNTPSPSPTLGHFWLSPLPWFQPYLFFNLFFFNTLLKFVKVVSVTGISAAYSSVLKIWCPIGLCVCVHACMHLF